MQEIRKNRTYNAKTFAIRDNIRTTQAHSGHIHYYNKLGLGDGRKEMRGIDTTLQFDKEKRGWYFHYHNFHPFLPEYSDEWVEFRDLFQGKDQTIAYKAECENRVKGSLVKKVKGLTDTNAVVYKDAFGEGCDLILYFTRSTLKKVVRIREEAKDPKGMRFKFELKLPEGVEVFRSSDSTRSDAYKLDLASKTFDSEKITMVGKQTEEMTEDFTYARPFIAWDSGDEHGIVKQETINVDFKVDMTTGKLYLTKKLSKGFIEGTHGDIFTDTTTSYYAGSEDQSYFNDNPSGDWQSGRDATTGTISQTNLFGGYYRGGSSTSVWRNALPFDIGLTGNEVISSATLHLYGAGIIDTVGSKRWINIVQPKPAGSTLASGDFDSYTGLPNSMEVGATQQNLSSMTTSGYNSFILNEKGISWINLREEFWLSFTDGHDIEDTDPATTSSTQGSRFEAKSSETTGTGEDPYLEITYTTPKSVISFDAIASGDADGSATNTYSHTVGSGDNRLLLVGIFEQTDAVTGVTYDGVSMTRAGSKVRVGTTGGVEYLHIFYLVNPNVGTANVVASRSSSTAGFRVQSMSIFGADQNDPITDTDSFSNDSADPATISLATERGDWAFVMTRNATANTYSDDNNFSTRFSDNSYNLFDSNGSAKKAIAYSTGFYEGSFDANGNGNAKWGLVAVSIREARPESSLKLKGSDNQLANNTSPSNLSIGASEDYSLKVKVKGGGGVPEYLGMYGDVGSGNDWTGLWVDSNQQVNFTIDNGVTAKTVTTTSNPLNDEWHEVEGKRVGSTISIEVDGVEEDTDTAYTDAINSDDVFTLGARRNGGANDREFTGNLKDFVVTIDGTERSNWDLDNNLLDSNANGNDLTASGDPEFIADTPNPIALTAFDDGNWRRRVKVKVLQAKVAGDLDFYPLYVDLSHLPYTFFDSINSGGADVRITYNDGKTVIPSELVAVDTTADTGEFYLMFEEKFFSDVDMEVYVYYDNDNPVAIQPSHTFGAENVWNDYGGVYHFQNGLKDSSGNQADGTERGTPTIATFGLGKGYQFSGADGLDLGHISSIAGVGKMSVSMLLQEEDVSADFMILGQDEIGESNSVQSYVEDGITGLIWAIKAVGNRVWFNPSTYMTDNTTHWLYQTFDGSATGNQNRLKQYVDGSAVTMSDQGTVEATTGTDTGVMNIAMRSTGTSAFDLYGFLDELRFALFTYTSQFVATEHDNQSSPSTFYEVGTEEYVPAPVVKFLQATTLDTDQTTHTFSSQDLGEVANDRHIIVAVTARSGVANRTISSVTVGGVTATAVVTSGFDSNKSISALYIAKVPTGTSGDVVVTFTGNKNCGIALYRVNDLDSITAEDTTTDNDSSTPMTGSLDVSADGFVVGSSMEFNSTVTWTGLDEDSELAQFSTNPYFSSAHKIYETAQTALAVQADWGSATAGAFSVASWGVAVKTYAKLNSADKDSNINLSSDGLTATIATGTPAWKGVRSTISKSSGKWYWEYTVDALGSSGTLNGIAKSTHTLAGYPGLEAGGWGYQSADGRKHVETVASAYGATYTTSDVIGVALDMDAGTLTMYKNGVSQGTLATGITGDIFAMVAMVVNEATSITANFGATPFAQTVPSGFNAGLYSVPVASTTASVTKSLAYAILKENVVTKSLAYAIDNVEAITKSAKYAVTSTPSAITKGLVYGVTLASSVTKSVAYAIGKSNNKTKALAYSVQSETALTKALQYVIDAGTSITKSVKYTVASTPSALTSSLTYAVSTVPSPLQKALKYGVLLSVAKTKVVAYKVLGSTAVTKSLEYSVDIGSAVSKAMKYTVTTTADAVTKSLAYRIFVGTSSETKSLKYSMNVSRTNQLSLRYVMDAVNVTTITKSLQYEVIYEPYEKNPSPYSAT